MGTSQRRMQYAVFMFIWNHQGNVVILMQDTFLIKVVSLNPCQIFFFSTQIWAFTCTKYKTSVGLLIPP